MYMGSLKETSSSWVSTFVAMCERMTVYSWELRQWFCI